MGLDLRMLQRQQLKVSAELQRECDNMLADRDLAFLPTVLTGKVGGKENRRNNVAFGKSAAAFMSEQIDRMAHERGKKNCSGKNIIYYGYGFGDDNGWIAKAIQNSIYVEIRDAGPRACANAQAYIDTIRDRIDEQFVPEVILDDISRFDRLAHHHGMLAVYACRILGLVKQPYRLLANLGRGLFRQEEPGELIAVQSFDKDNSVINCGRMTPLNKKSAMQSLEQGAGRTLELLEGPAIHYYHKVCTPIVVKVR